MKRYRAMLDTNIVSNALRYPLGDIAFRMAAEPDRPVCLSAIVAAELRFGAAKLKSEKLSLQIAGLFEALDVIPFDHEATNAYGRIRAELERQGRPIGPLDTLIAAHALALDLPLVTDNVREFSRVPGLRVENWLD